MIHFKYDPKTSLFTVDGQVSPIVEFSAPAKLRIPNPNVSDNEATNLNPLSLEALTKAKQTLAAAVAEMQAAMARAQDERDNAQARALDVARIEWATQALSASNDAANLLIGVTPSFASAQSLIGNALSILSRARATKDLSLFSALGKAIKSSITVGELPSEFASAFAGDPNQTPNPIGSEVDWDSLKQGAKKIVESGVLDFPRPEFNQEDFYPDMPDDNDDEEGGIITNQALQETSDNIVRDVINDSNSIENE